MSLRNDVKTVFYCISVVWKKNIWLRDLLAILISLRFPCFLQVGKLHLLNIGCHVELFCMIRLPHYLLCVFSIYLGIFEDGINQRLESILLCFSQHLRLCAYPLSCFKDSCFFLRKSFYATDKLLLFFQYKNT